ncbi:hypothetical protein, partial [Thiolapillus sp.]|uniref:hypothetical protein n=1 Tax=Thiolapillus sp. TaxID=2017437 RepID=UPI0025D8DE2E
AALLTPMNPLDTPLMMEKPVSVDTLFTCNSNLPCAHPNNLSCDGSRQIKEPRVIKWLLLFEHGVNGV